MNRTITFRSKYILVPLYKSLVRPVVEYCTPAWSLYYQKDKNLIERLQHRLTSMIPGLKSMSYIYTDRLKQLDLWSLKERRNMADLIEVFRICHGLSGIDCEKLFERVKDSQTRGHSLKLKKFRCRLDFRKYFFSERIVDRWMRIWWQLVVWTHSKIDWQSWDRNGRVSSWTHSGGLALRPHWKTLFLVWPHQVNYSDCAMCVALPTK